MEAENKHYEVKVEVINQDQKKEVITYLTDAVNFADAESIVSKNVGQYYSEFSVKSVSSKRLSEVITDDQAEDSYEVKVSVITVDEVNAKEKRNTISLIIQADSMKDAEEITKKSFTISDTIIEQIKLRKNYEIVSNDIQRI